MINSNLVETIKLLSLQEISELRLWLESPFHNRSLHKAEIVKLFALIADLYPDFPAEPLARDLIYQSMYGKETPVKGKLDKAMSELLQQIRDFAITNEYLKDTNRFEQWLNWASWLRNREEGERFELIMAKIEKWQLEERGASAEYFQRQYLLEREKHEWQSLTNQKKGDINLVNVVRALDISYHLTRLEFLNRLQLQQKVTMLLLPQEVNPELLQYEIPLVYLEESPILYAEYTIFRLLKHKNPPEEEVFSLTHWLRAHQHEMSFEYQNRFWAYLRGLYTMLQNSGRSDICMVLHQIHQENLEKGYLFYEGKLSPSAYKNVTFIALRAGNTAWALEFVEKYKDLVIGENETRDFYRFNLARCLFEMKKFAEVLDCLPAASLYTDYHSAARRLELQSYYELNSELLPYKIDSYRMYVYRATKNVLSNEKKEMLLNFVHILQQICQSPKGDKARAEQILRRIEKKKKVAEKSWLIGKTKELGDLRKI